MRGFKGLKHIAAGFIVIILVFTGSYLPAFGDTGKVSSIRGVVVLDYSLSMKDNDKNGIRIEAFKSFVDMCQAGDKIGFIAYGGKILKDTGIRDLKSQADKDKLKKEAEGISLSKNTDIGLALKTAVNRLLASKDGGEMPFILLLSDGFNDSVKGQEKISQRYIDDYIKKARENGIPVYTVVLQGTGDVDIPLMQKISDETGGKPFVVNDAAQLTGLFSKIFADFIIDLKLDMKEVSKKQINKGESLGFEAGLLSNGNEVTDISPFKGKLIIKALDNNESYEKGMENREKLFFGEFKAEKTGKYEIFVRVEGKGWVLDGAPVTISVEEASKETSTPPAPVKTKQSPGQSLLFAALGASVLALIFILGRRLGKSGRKVKSEVQESIPALESADFTGQLMITIREKDTGEVAPPIFRKLEGLQGGFTLYELLNELPEYSSTQAIRFLPGKDRMLIVMNNSNCSIYKNGENLREKKRFSMKNEEKLLIGIDKTLKTIELQYFNGEK